MTVLALRLSVRAGALAQRTGPRLPTTVGALLVAAGLLAGGAVVATAMVRTPPDAPDDRVRNGGLTGSAPHPGPP